MFIMRQNMPRWLIFIFDILIVISALLLAYMVRFNFHVPEIEIRLWPRVFGTVIGIRALSFVVSKTYAGIIRYTSTEDAVRIFLVVFSGSVLFSGINLISYYFIDGKFLIPFSIIVIEFMTVVLLMVTFRIVVKIAYLELINPAGNKSKVIIFGAGEAGLIAKHALDRDPATKYKVAAFIDDDKNKWGKMLEGVVISEFDKLPGLLKDGEIDNLIIASQKLKPEKKQAIVDVCLEHNVKILTVPPVSDWINGELSFRQIKNIRIEDLLERDEIKLDVEAIHQELKGKKIMITGASGSIGSELVRQILSYEPEKVILVDQAESGLFDLEVELNDKYSIKSFRISVADICNENRMNEIFKNTKPELVFHAAAYKHVPLMENNPTEAVYTNVRGTKIVADLAVKHGVQKFIMISTDKAVNPTNVMGASKRIAEIYAQSVNQNEGTRFIRISPTVRSASAIPAARRCCSSR